MFEESVAVPPGLKFLGGDEGGVVNNAGFWAYGVVVFLGCRRLLRGPFGVGGVGDWVDITGKNNVYNDKTKSNKAVERSTKKENKQPRKKNKIK